ncbi:hypothetical protein PCASD_01933 [Puccinia coronata f. sp. avenae]|uniref:Uncharacterized protein n=1 Tax=Puccinia coronata f. sp. avenae TaxID=200324 RepID=A0A2N5VHH5_9BASI|nr:hypothetical protein PCASD_01933 [Puccinia coronata f. sp. avenae]
MPNYGAATLTLNGFSLNLKLYSQITNWYHPRPVRKDSLGSYLYLPTVLQPLHSKSLLCSTGSANPNGST